MDKLSDMFDRQIQLQKEMFGYQLPDDDIEGYKYSCLALIGELGEVLEADKRWKNIRKEKYDKEGKLDELTDCMAFLINLVLFSGFTSEEFYNAFVKKNNYNFKRLIENGKE